MSASSRPAASSSAPTRSHGICGDRCGAGSADSPATGRAAAGPASTLRAPPVTEPAPATSAPPLTEPAPATSAPPPDPDSDPAPASPPWVAVRCCGAGAGRSGVTSISPSPRASAGMISVQPGRIRLSSVSWEPSGWVRPWLSSKSSR